MKAIFLIFAGVLSGTAQNGTPPPASAPAPVIITPGSPPPDNGVVVQEVGPSLRNGRRGGVFVTGAPPIPTTNGGTVVPPRLIVGTNRLGTNAVGGTSS